MKLKVTNEEVVVVENTPIILDVKGVNAIDFETPNEGGTAYVVKFRDNTGKSYNGLIANGKVNIPREIYKEGIIEVIVYKASSTDLKPIFASPLKIWHIGSKESYTYYLGSGYSIINLRNEHASLFAQVNATRRSITKLQQEARAMKEANASLTEEVVNLKKELADFKALFDQNVEVMNEALEKIAELEERYDTLAV